IFLQQTIRKVRRSNDPSSVTLGGSFSKKEGFWARSARPYNAAAKAVQNSAKIFTKILQFILDNSSLV
ncbi:MAG: hypothetical protein J6Q99_01575, partial [Oscillospiraceae bacterium]|nr:hypothetical protein [Oscillospiraceae bacterium]